MKGYPDEYAQSVDTQRGEFPRLCGNVFIGNAPEKPSNRVPKVYGVIRANLSGKRTEIFGR